MKKVLMGVLVTVIVILALALSIMFYLKTPDEGREILNDGKIYLKEDNYEKAIEYFAIASNRLEKQEEKAVAKEFWHLTNGYIRAKGFYESKNYREAKKIIGKVEKSPYYEYIKEEIEVLKQEIDVREKKAI